MVCARWERIVPLLLGAVGALASGCASAPAARSSPAPAMGACESHLDAGGVFAEKNVDGVFVLRDDADGCVRTTDAIMADQGFRPQSTFKIPSSLIGLEAHVIEGEHHVWKWDGASRGRKDWEQDLDLAGALRVSCVPCFQDVARRVGADRMRQYLHQFRYGNEDIGGPVDEFWLEGPLRITPRQQTEFLHRMLAGELGVRRENAELVGRRLEIERGKDFTYRGKTGLGTQDGRAIAWLVGYVERAGHRYIYATFIASRGPTFAHDAPSRDIEAEIERISPLRKTITRTLLVRANVLPPP